MNKTTLNEIAEIVMGQSPEAEFVSQEAVGLPLLNGPAEFTDRYPIPVQFTSDSKRIAEESDILFCVRGSTTGRMNIADQKYAIGRGLAAIRHISDSSLNVYIKALIEINLKKLLGGTLGSVFPNLTKDQLFGLECYCHDENDQEKISKALSALDSKIELNNKINAELEQMAKTLYDYWFVQFDFPISKEQAQAMGKPELEGKPYKTSGGKMVWNDVLKREIPEGWGDERIEDLGTVVGGSTPSKADESNFSTRGTAWITPKDLSLNLGNKFISRGEVDVTDKGLRESSLNVLPKGSVLMSSRAPVGYLAVNRIECTTNQGFKSLVCNKEYTAEYVLYVLKQNMGVVEANATGSTFKEISGSTFKSISVVKPKKLLIDKFVTIAKPIFDRQNFAELQNSELASLRDWLLPMLMNGQVRVG